MWAVPPPSLDEEIMLADPETGEVLGEERVVLKISFRFKTGFDDLVSIKLGTVLYLFPPSLLLIGYHKVCSVYLAFAEANIKWGGD